MAQLDRDSPRISYEKPEVELDGHSLL
jgi:hypothetical protein